MRKKRLIYNTVETIKESLIKDLDKLIRCLEIYLWDYVGQTQVKVRLSSFL